MPGFLEGKKTAGTSLFSIIEEHLQRNPKPSLHETSELYEFLHGTRFEPEEMVKTLKLVLAAKQHFDLDVMFFSKGLLYSSIKNHDTREKIEFMYAFDKLNLLNLFVPKFLDSLQTAKVKEYRALSFDLSLMNFHTISKTIDSRQPGYSTEFT